MRHWLTEIALLPVLIVIGIVYAIRKANSSWTCYPWP